MSSLTAPIKPQFPNVWIRESNQYSSSLVLSTPHFLYLIKGLLFVVVSTPLVLDDDDDTFLTAGESLLILLPPVVEVDGIGKGLAKALDRMDSMSTSFGSGIKAAAMFT